MATSIPYDPSLVLGHLVLPAVLDHQLLIAGQEAQIDAAQDKLNALVAMKRSVDMTIQELMTMDIDPRELIQQSRAAAQEVSKAAAEYAKERIEREQVIQKFKGQTVEVHAGLESPIDYVRTQIKSMPLSADSLKMDAQYFSFDEEEQEAQNTVSTIKDYVTETTSFLGDQFATQASGAVAAQVTRQRETHDIAGTLVITAGCTHKNAVVLAPLVLDVDKAIRIWNRIFTDDKDKIRVGDEADMRSIAAEQGTSQEKAVHLLSGATYGSSFIGMVHVLRRESTTTGQSMTSVAATLQEQLQVGGWFADEAGGFGVDESFSNDVKNLLSMQDIASHISIFTVGSIPSIKSNQVQVGVKQFADFDPAKMMGKLAALANATTKDKSSVAASAESARTGKQMMAIQDATINSVVLGLGKVDDGTNKILDINSLMTAFEDYITKALAGTIGVPINYYLTPITRTLLAEMWVSKYFPKRRGASVGDAPAATTKPSSS